MTILVTGATGTVGSQLVEQLLSSGKKVRVVSRDAGRAAKLRGAHAEDLLEAVIGDLADPKTANEAVTGAEKIFLNTADIAQDRLIIDAAKKERSTSHVVKLSTLDAPTGSIAINRWHRDRENQLMDSGLPWTMVRPGAFNSNALNWKPMIKGMGKVFHAYADSKNAPIHPFDIAAVAKVALTEEGHVGQGYRITGPELLTNAEMVATLSRVLGRPIECVPVDDEAARAGMKRSNMPDVLVEALVELAQHLRSRGEVPATDEVLRLTRRPPRTFEQWCTENKSAFD